MPSNPRTPKSTVKVRRLPKVGDTIMVPATVTRVQGEDERASVTIRIKATGHLETAAAKYLLGEE